MDEVADELGISPSDITRDYDINPDRKKSRLVNQFHQMVLNKSYLFTPERQAELFGMNPKAIRSRIYRACY